MYEAIPKGGEEIETRFFCTIQRSNNVAIIISFIRISTTFGSQEVWKIEKLLNVGFAWNGANDFPEIFKECELYEIEAIQILKTKKHRH